MIDPRVHYYGNHAELPKKSFGRRQPSDKLIKRVVKTSVNFWFPSDPILKAEMIQKVAHKHGILYRSEEEFMARFREFLGGRLKDYFNQRVADDLQSLNPAA